ncbi:MAG: SPOR domain-containing protein [Candidatus Amoebophilus sp.]
MAVDTNKPQSENNNDFGLPKAEFKPIESTGNSQWLKITIIIAGIVLIIGVGIVFWLFQRPSSNTKNDFMSNTLENQQMEEEENEDVMFNTNAVDITKATTVESTKPKIEIKENKDTVIAKKSQETTTKKGEPADSDDAALAELDKISDSFIAKPERKPSSFIEQLRAGEFDHKNVEKEEVNEEEPPIMTINAPKGLYYVIVASHIDMDLAMDYAQKIVQHGTHVKLITPTKDHYFVRVAVAQEKTFEEATHKAEGLKTSYGESVWVMKY